jgi:hypothetical protein
MTAGSDPAVTLQRHIANRPIGRGFAQPKPLWTGQVGQATPGPLGCLVSRPPSLRLAGGEWTEDPGVTLTVSRTAAREDYTERGPSLAKMRRALGS